LANPVVDILLNRAARGSRVPHGDGFSVALCVEGGAMRGVVSAGMLSALEELGLTQAFDGVYGSSGGALNAAYFLADHADFSSRIYWEDINNRHFIDLHRAWRGRPIVDIDFLLDDVMTRRKPLDTARVLASATPLAVLATDVATAGGAVFRHFTDGRDLMAAMRAGATMPILAGGPYVCRGRRYFDASLTEPIPVPTAEADGHSHLLVLLTRPPGHRTRVSSLLERLFVGRRLRRVSPALAARFETRGAPYAALLETIASGTGPLGRAIVLGLRPGGPEISKLERRRDVLLDAANQGRRAVTAAFT
jgi:predicted patatin/cPLA2 family phospholipase